MKEFRYVGTHVGDLEGGRQVEPGEFTGPIDPEAPQNASLISEELLLEVADGTYKEVTGEDPPEPVSDPILKGEALDERARELDIEGRSSMTADELRSAIAAAEANTEKEGENA